MNILPFVIIMVLVLGMFSLSFLRTSIGMEKEKDAYVAYFKGRKEVRNQLEERAYKVALKEKELPEDEQEFVYFRERWEGSPLGQLNLSLLAGNDPEKNTLYSIALKYIQRLYGNRVLGQDKNLSKKILDQLIKIQKQRLQQNKASLPLIQIDLKDPSLKDIYYNMLRGTNTYNLKQGKGYPPLADVITFDKIKSKPIHFNYINTCLLEVLFGSKVTKEIMDAEITSQQQSEEVNNSYALKDNELQAIARKYNKNQPLALLSFETVKADPPIVWTDPKTGISVRHFP